MEAFEHWRNSLGMLSVVLAIAAAAIYVYQTLRGAVRPHPLSWFVFGVLSAVGYWVQRDEGAAQGSWALLAMTIICFLFVTVSLARGERIFQMGMGVRLRPNWRCGLRPNRMGPTLMAAEGRNLRSTPRG